MKLGEIETKREKCFENNTKIQKVIKSKQKQSGNENNYSKTYGKKQHEKHKKKVLGITIPIAKVCNTPSQYTS